MIRPLNLKGKDVLYNECIPIAPLIRLDDKQLSRSLTAANIEDDDVTGTEKRFSWPIEVTQLIGDLKDTAESIADSCFGLASTQIWHKDPKKCPSVFVLRWPIDKTINERGWDWKEIINPMVQTSGKSYKIQEGCLSYPGTSYRKRRKSNIILKYQTLDNPGQVTLKLTRAQHDPLPWIIQHEIDHLMGKCIRSKNFK
jgi:peptide deformylase